MDNIIEPGRSPGSWLDRFEPFGEDALRTPFDITEETTSLQNQRYADASGRKVRQPPPILAVYAAASPSARRAATNVRCASYRDEEPVAVFRRALNDESARNKL